MLISWKKIRGFKYLTAPRPCPPPTSETATHTNSFPFEEEGRSFYAMWPAPEPGRNERTFSGQQYEATVIPDQEIIIKIQLHR